jgi:RNA polymerase-binding transcription factor DksA
MRIDTDRFRTDLEERRERVLAVIEHRERGGSLEEEIGELVSSSADNHLADTATETYDRELDEGLGVDAERLLGEIDAALGRIADGSYGRCVVCGNPIDEERLEAMPHATLCIEDKRRQERG